MHGDKESEAFLSEMVSAQPLQGERNMSMESLYEYGSRAGVWRILKLFREYDIPLTIFAVAMAAQRHPDVIRAMVAAGHEICSHGYRWIDYQHMDEAQEREHMLEAIRILTEISGERPLGWFDLDLLSVTEIDPMWSSDLLSFLLNPECGIPQTSIWHGVLRIVL